MISRHLSYFTVIDKLAQIVQCGRTVQELIKLVETAFKLRKRMKNSPSCSHLFQTENIEFGHFSSLFSRVGKETQIPVYSVPVERLFLLIKADNFVVFSLSLIAITVA